MGNLDDKNINQGPQGEPGSKEEQCAKDNDGSQADFGYNILLSQIVKVLLKQMGLSLSFENNNCSDDSNNKEPLNYAVSLLYKQKGLCFVSYDTTTIGNVLVQDAEEEKFEPNDVIRVEGIKNYSAIKETKEYIIPLCNVILIIYPDKIEFEENETQESIYSVTKTSDGECNIRLSEKIDKLIKEKMKDGYKLSIEVLGNTKNIYRLSKVNAISNGVLFGEVADVSKKNLFAAIPLRSIVSVSLEPASKENN